MQPTSSHPSAMTVTTPSECEVRFTRHFKAPRALVFETFTQPEWLRRWLIGPDGWALTVCEVDLIPGGRFRYVWTKPDGKAMGMGGRFVEVTPPSRLVHVEVFDQDWTGGETTVTTDLAEHDGMTEMTMTVVYSSTTARDRALATGMTSGMEMSYARLDMRLAS
ncbi:MAG: SRPBCC family protein [Acidobacteria bacterium]|nr:SRPBCC family protein [Acidobacteriota bacterium]